MFINTENNRAWVLQEEVPLVLQDVFNILTEACRHFQLNLDHEQDGRMKPDKFLLTSAISTNQVKCMVTLAGIFIYEADLALKLQRQQVVPHQTRIYSENPWRLQQIQDAGNHLTNALSIVADVKDDKICLTSGDRVVTVLDEIISSIHLGYECLTLPRKRTLEEIVRNPSLKLFKPALPNDAVVSFYIQAQKLVLAVYHLCTNQLSKVDIAARYQLECSIPWLNESLILFTAARRKCQLLKDKLAIFTQALQCDGSAESTQGNISSVLSDDRYNPFCSSGSSHL